jgi:pyruvate kinase
MRDKETLNMKRSKKAVRIALQWRRTKIIATLGPATATAKKIDELLDAGVNLIRLNMSHGDHDQHRALFAAVRRSAEAHDRPVAILMDLCGPKIRVGRFRDGAIRLRQNAQVTVTTRDCLGGDGLIPSQYRELHRDAQPGERILLDDGKLELAIEAIEGMELRCMVVTGGTLKDHKGMNLPDSRLSVPAFTDKDREDARLAVELGADFLALSFVRDRQDILNLQACLAELGAEIPIIAKIEKPEAVANIAEILDSAYAIMIARGDLGIELPLEKVPLIQEELIQLARSQHKPVIVATQMLESMIKSASPTRAEVGDVATAAASSADAVMLSGETAVGRYPLKAVQTMDRILREIEEHQWKQGCFGKPVLTDHAPGQLSLRKAVADAASSLANHLKLQGIVIPTNSGTTARIIASKRPTAPCLGICPNPRIVRRLALHWGIVPICHEEMESQNWRALCETIAKDYQLTRTGNTVLIVSGFNEDPALNEPVMKVMRL